ncbi:hypothetical protein FNH09_31255 [Streptomyces adustus]|uniref:Uncharacterized protein n=1 Tax=Streptomyces adustus TaxID=1609272 RepID=A0A5N8VLG2_9ACTN|nr:hypothetical protein [Streptomyces adustus]MPY35552.1 hypothetical protein [Streptomyces adustus]
MAQAEKNDDVVKPLDNHASLVEQDILTTVKETASEGTVTTLDNHASSEEAKLLDNHASDETA